MLISFLLNIVLSESYLILGVPVAGSNFKLKIT